MSEDASLEIYQKLSQFYQALPKELRKSLEKVSATNLVNMDRMTIVCDYLKAYEENELFERLKKTGFVGLFTYLRLAYETKKQFSVTKEYEGDNDEAFCVALEVEVDLLKTLARFLNLSDQFTVADFLSQETPFHPQKEAESYLDRFQKYFEEMDDPRYEDSHESTKEGIQRVTEFVELLRKKYKC